MKRSNDADGRPKTSRSAGVFASSHTRPQLLSLLLPLLLLAAATEGQQQRFFLPSVNTDNFALPRAQFQDDVDSAELIVSQRRLSSAEPSSSSFFSSQPQLPLGAFTNSGPFSRPPTAQQFILNGQQAQFQPIRNAGSLSFSDPVSAISQPSFFQQPPSQRLQPQQSQSFNFFPGSSSQQQRFRPIAQQQRPEQQDSAENFDENKNSQSSLTLQSSSQERFPSIAPRRPQQQTVGVISNGRNPSSVESSGWWNSATLDEDRVPVNINSNEETAVEVNTKDDTVEFNQQNQNQQQKRGRGQPLQGRRRPITTPLPSSTQIQDEQEPAAIGFTVIHDENDNKSLWSQPTITTHRPQLGQTSFRARTTPSTVSGSNRRPTTYNPLSVASSSSTSVRTPPLQPTAFTSTVNRQQPTTIRSRKPSLISTTTTTIGTLDDELEQEQQSEEEIRQPPLRKSTTTQPPPALVTTMRNQIKPRLNNPVASVPQQQRMKKVVNNPAIIQSIITRKPILTSTSTLAPSTTTIKEEEYEDYEDIEYSTLAHTTTTKTTTTTTTDQPSTKKQTKLSPVTQSPIKTMNQKNDSLLTTTESWFVVASVQTSRSVSSSSSLSGSGGTNQNVTTQDATTSTVTTPAVNKHRFNNKPTITTTSTTTVESIIDKLDRVQSELSNGILYGSASNNNNSRRILTDIQSNGNGDDKRNDVIMSSFTTPTTEKTATPTITTTTSTTTTPSTTSKPDEEEDDEEEKEEDDSDDTDKETTIVRKFVPSKQRTSTISNVVTTSTTRPSTQTGKKKSLIDSVKFDELLTSGLLPAGFNPKPPPAYKSKVITTTTTTETSLTVTNSSTPSTSSDITVNTTPTTTTVKTKSTGLKIKFVDDTSALSSLLPPGFKLEEKIKPVEILPPSLLPPGFKIPIENADSDSKNKEQEVVSTTLVPSTDEPSTTIKITTSSTTGIVFPNNSKGTNNTGTRKPLPSSKKIQASVTIAPVIQKGWPVRATTEFTGWSTPSTTPLSIEKLLLQSKTSDLAAALTSTPEPTTSTTTTTTTTTMKPPPTTTPGQCSEGDSVCELVGTVRIVGSGSEKWVPELLDHNTEEWRLLANEVESQLDKVYSKSPALSKWYKKITIDSFSPGNNGIISNGKPDKNAGILVDFFVQLNQLGRTVSTADIRRLFHETLQKEGSLGSSAQPLQYGNGGDYDGLYLKLGRFTVDAARTDFIVLPKPTRGVTAIAGTEDAWLPQWAVAVMVIGLASLLFVLIFGLTVLVTRHRNNKKVPPPTVQTMIPDDHHQHMYGTGKNGPAGGGSRHAMHHPPAHSNSNYNVSSYGYDNYAIDDDMMMLDDDDLEDVDRLYDMDAVWADHDHDKHKIPSNSSTKKYRDTHYDSWRSTALSPQALSPAKTGYYPSGGGGAGGYGYGGADPNGYGGTERRHYHTTNHRDASSVNPRSSHHHYNTHQSPRKPPQQYHADYDTDF